MSQFKVLPVVVLGLIALVSGVAGDCGVCSTTTYSACVNKTAFAVCFDGVKMSNQIIQCPEGKICTGNQGICMDDDGINQPACVLTSPQCNTCAGAFACISQTQFAFCDSAGTLTATAHCQEGKFCSVQHFIEKGTICGPWCVVEPTCSNADPVTTPAPELEWQESCDAATGAGAYPNIYDKTCRTYVYCEMLNNVMDSVLFTCKSGYFNKDTKMCQEAKPTGCT